MCGDLLALVDEIRNKAVPKTGECGQPPRPQPDHVVFALSQIEGDINSAMTTLKLVADSL